MSGGELDEALFGEDWEGGDRASEGTDSCLAAEHCRGIIRAGEELIPVDPLVGWIGNTANAQFKTFAVAV